MDGKCTIDTIPIYHTRFTVVAFRAGGDKGCTIRNVVLEALQIVFLEKM